MVKWPDTDMYFVHPSSPAPLGVEAGEDHPARMIGCAGNCAQGRSECDRECAEVRSAQDAGKQMSPVDELAEARGVFGVPLGVLCVIAVLAAVARVVWGV